MDSDNSAKYHVHISNLNKNAPENLTKLLDFMAENTSADDINKIK